MDNWALNCCLCVCVCARQNKLESQLGKALWMHLSRQLWNAYYFQIAVNGSCTLTDATLNEWAVFSVHTHTMCAFAIVISLKTLNFFVSSSVSFSPLLFCQKKIDWKKIRNASNQTIISEMDFMWANQWMNEWVWGQHKTALFGIISVCTVILSFIDRPDRPTDRPT